jgi:hypothetical protein
MINKTSYVENCETSAWGRALANLGIGIETSIASSNEVEMAIAKQEVIANVDDLTDRLGLVKNFDEVEMATLKADFVALVEQMPKDEQWKFQDHSKMTPERYRKGIAFFQSKLKEGNL